jgi:predicted TIM-barrel enzyme
VIALCHGGPVYMHDDAQGVNRFYGTSSVERLQSEIAIREQMKSSRPFGFRCQGLKSSLLGPPRGGIR